jgi:hypothetical protein
MLTSVGSEDGLFLNVHYQVFDSGVGDGSKMILDIMAPGGGTLHAYEMDPGGHIRIEVSGDLERQDLLLALANIRHALRIEGLDNPPKG